MKKAARPKKPAQKKAPAKKPAKASRAKATPATRASSSKPQAALSLTALDLATLEKLLDASGSRHVSRERIEADLASGAPRNADGTVNLVQYAAWLARESA